MITSKYLSYGTVDDGNYVSYYSLKAQSISLTLQPGRVFSFTIHADAVANFNLGLFDFDLSISDQTITVTGQVNLAQQGGGYKVVFVPQSVTCNPLSWFADALGVSTTGLVSKLPEISTFVNSPLLVNIAPQYFTSGTPTLTTTTNEIILSLTLVAGPRFVTAYNDVDQRLDVGNVQDEEGSSNFVSYPSPKTFEWNIGTTQKLQTPDALLDASIGKDKYRHWSSNITGIKTDIAPRRIQLTVGTDDETYKAQFDKAQRVQLSNYLLDAQSGGGTVTYESTTAPVIDDYDYYHATQTHPINTSVPNGTQGFNWIFTGWSDGNLSQSRNIVVNNDVHLVANYKAHLASTSSTATASNGQRKVITFGATSHAVYVSGGSIFYTRNNGTGWSNEVLISYSGAAKNPSIAVTCPSGVPYVHIVWEETTPFEVGPRQVVVYLRSTNGGDTWDGIGLTGDFIFGDEGYTSINDAVPVISGTTTGPTTVIWRFYNEWEEGLVLLTEPFSNDHFYTVPNTGSLSRSPVSHVGDGPLNFVYEDNGAIFYQEFNITSSPPYTPTFGSRVNLTAGYSMTNNANPSIATNNYDGVRVYVSWDATSGTAHHTFFRERNTSGTWLAPVEFSHGTHQESKTSIGVDGSRNRIYVFWQCDNHIAMVSRPFTNTTWTAVADRGQGYSPSLPDFISGGIQALEIWTTGSSAPYSIKLGSLDPAPLAPQNLQVSAYLAGTNPKRYSPKLVWTANTDGDVARYRIYRRITSSQPYSKIDSVSHPTNTYIDYAVLTGTLDTAFYKIAAVDFAGQESGFSNTVNIQTNQASKSFAGGTSDEVAPVPAEFLLGQNFPNPFNPTTVIKYQLPEASYVTLKLYDVLGREVGTLLDALKEAGFHEVSLDASQLSSGVYMYRMAAGNYIAVKKLMIMK